MIVACVCVCFTCDSLSLCSPFRPRHALRSFDSNLYTLHFTADAPISLRTLLFVGETQLEKYGLGRLENGVNLYSRKVLIEGKSAHILPEWLRFVRGTFRRECVLVCVNIGCFCVLGPFLLPAVCPAPNPPFAEGTRGGL